MHVLTSAMTYTTQLHALPDHDSQQGQALMDPASAANTAMSGEDHETSAPANTMHINPANSDLGDRAEHEAAREMEGQISGQGGDGEQNRTAVGSAGQYTTGTSQEMTQEGHDIATAGEETQYPSMFTNEMSANNLANSDLGARAEDDAAGGMGDRINGQREDGEKSRTAGGGAGQHTTGTRQPPEAMSSGDPGTTTRAHKSCPFRTPDQERYKPGQGLTTVKGRISKSGTPASIAAQPTPQSVGSKRPKRDWP